MNKIIGIIPSRYASTRFPGKPLAVIEGKTMIQHVYEQSLKCSMLSKVVVATDDDRIYNTVNDFGGEAIMTSKNHVNGTSRCNEVVEKLESQGIHSDVAINIQGDEPRINPEQITSVAKLFDKDSTDIATLAKAITNFDELTNPNVVKVVFGGLNNAIYFSRQPIPFFRDATINQWLENAKYYKHIGIYGYRIDVLKKIINLPKGNLENSENLEQLRWLENGINIAIDITEYESIAIDSPKDLLKLETKS